LFLRAKSWGVDVNGLPIWWEQQYGLMNVNPNALDSAGDGWTIYQKYVLGVAPGAWATPAAPQGLTVNFNQAGLTAVINWLPSAGALGLVQKLIPICSRGYCVIPRGENRMSIEVNHLHFEI